MKLTPLDIRRNEFAKAWRGFNREEVESFLTMVADEVEGLIGENRDLSRRVSELEKEVDEFREMERTLMDTLVKAQRAADDTKESTQREAEVTKREARVRADQAVDAARIEAERLMMEARKQAHATLEDARRKAHDVLETARRGSEKLLAVAKEEAADVERQTINLARRRDAFIEHMRAYLTGQIEALKSLGSEEAPRAEPYGESRLGEIGKRERAALADLEKKLAEFAEETAPVDTTASERAEDAANDTEEATVQPEKDARDGGDGAEVLVGGKKRT